MGEAISQIVPHPLRLQVHRDDMSLSREVLKGIPIFIPSATDATTHHADPVIFTRSTEGADGGLTSIKSETGLAG
jgi:hypothetical protein